MTRCLTMRLVITQRCIVIREIRICYAKPTDYDQLCQGRQNDPSL